MFSVACQSQSPFELMDHDGLLTEFYTNKLSFGPALYYAQDLVSHIAHRFQSMEILEIGKQKNKPKATSVFTIIKLLTSCFSFQARARAALRNTSCRHHS